MPYIKEEDRQRVDRTLNPQNAGELNYLISNIVIEYLFRNNTAPRYQDYNDVIGVLSAASMELYRRSAAPYEDTKIEENGDVYPPTKIAY